MVMTADSALFFSAVVMDHGEEVEQKYIELVLSIAVDYSSHWSAYLSPVFDGSSIYGPTVDE